MPRRGLMAVPVLLASMALTAPAAFAADSLKMYRTTVDDEKVAVLGDLGVDLGETGYDRSVERAQTIFVDLIDAQAKRARAAGLGLEEVVPGPHVTETQIAKKLAAAESGSRTLAKPETGGDSPNQFYDVFRTYSEPGGIKDEMTSLAAANKGMAKLVVIGKSGQGQDIVALKVTKDARNVADGARPAMLFSAVNHAREWIAAEVGRRMPTWWLEHANDPEVANLLANNELWFLPIQNPDGYDYTFTCGTGFRSADNEMCGATLVTDPADPLRGTYVYKNEAGVIRAPNAAQPNVALRKPTQRLWRKTVRDNDGNGTFGDGQDGIDPNRNYPTAWGLDEEGASNSRSSATFRGLTPFSEPENLAYDRLLRKITPEAVINYHSAAQLLLYPFGYITDVYADDDPWFKAITGTDGDAAVDPYISQRSSDLYITNGETTDHAYNKYGSMSWTPELDECETAAGGTFCSGGSGFTFPDDEGKVEAVFEKNLDFARNVAATTLDRDRPDRPRNATDDETQYQVKGSPDIEPNRFGVSYGNDQILEANARKVLGPVDFVVQVNSGPGGGSRTLTLRAAPWTGGERFGDLRGKYYQKVRAQIPADFVQPGTATDRPAARGRRRGQRPRDRGLPAAAVLLPRGLHAAGERPEAGARGGGRGLQGPLAEQDGVRVRSAVPPAARRRPHGRRLHRGDVRRRQPAGRPERGRRLEAAVGPRRPRALRRRRVLHGRRPAPAGRRRGRDGLQRTVAATRPRPTGRSGSRARRTWSARACATRRCCATT